MKSWNNTDLYFYFPLLVLSLCFGLPFLEVAPLGRNEVLSLQTGHGSLAEFFVAGKFSHLFAAPDQQPLYFYLLRMWKYLWGMDIWGLRLLSVIFYSLSCLACYRLLRFHFTKINSLLISLLYTSNIFLIDYAQYIRFYTFSTLLCFIVLIHFEEFQLNSRKKNFIKLYFSSFALFLTNIFGLLILFPIGLKVLFNKSSFEKYKEFFWSLNGIFIFFILYKGYYAIHYRFFVRSVFEYKFEVATQYINAFHLLHIFFPTFSIGNNWGYILAGSIILIALLYSFLFLRKKGNIHALNIVVGIFSCLVLSVILVIEEAVPRYYMIFYPSFFISIAWFFHKTRVWLSIPLFLSALFINFHALPYQYARTFTEGYYLIFNEIKEEKSPIFLNLLWRYQAYIEPLFHLNNSVNKLDYTQCDDLNCFKEKTKNLDRFIFVEHSDGFTKGEKVIRKNYKSLGFGIEKFKRFGSSSITIFNKSYPKFDTPAIQRNYHSNFNSYRLVKDIVEDLPKIINNPGYFIFYLPEETRGNFCNQGDNLYIIEYPNEIVQEVYPCSNSPVLWYENLFIKSEHVRFHNFYFFNMNLANSIRETINLFEGKGKVLILVENLDSYQAKELLKKGHFVISKDEYLERIKTRNETEVLNEIF